jgi:hypothetical protein
LLLWSHWPHGLRRKFSVVRLLRLWVRIPREVWMSLCCECCVLSGRGLCDDLITRPEESYRLRCVVACDLETSWKRRPWPTAGCCAKNKQTNKHACRNVQINSIYTCIWNVFGCGKYLLMGLARIMCAERSFCCLFKYVHRAVYLGKLCVKRRVCKYCKKSVFLRKETSTVFNRLCCLMHGFDLGQTVSSLRQTMGN